MSSACRVSEMLSVCITESSTMPRYSMRCRGPSTFSSERVRPKALMMRAASCALAHARAAVELSLR